jgi:glycosyltransferase involved in cell wall biosynthesis
MTTVATEQPRVSVVIPTRGRPTLLVRALDSVRAQTASDWEAVVVVDGPDAETERALQTKADADPRIRFIVNERSMGGGEARNVGIRAARGDLVALLDDDDEWLPERLERHLAELGPDAARADLIPFAQTIRRTPHGDYAWPRRPPLPDEHISDYLFGRRSPFAGDGGIQTSAILARRDLFLDVPFDPALPRHQDTDWLLRAWAAGARLRYCATPLSIWHAEQARDTITARHDRDWQLTLEWIRARRHLVTRRAYASFLLVRGGDLTSNALSPRGAAIVAVEAFRHGRPSATALLLFAARWILPKPLRRRIRASFGRNRAADT